MCVGIYQLCVLWSQRSEENVWSLKLELQMFWAACGCWESTPGPLEERSGLLVTGPPLRLHFWDALLAMPKNLILTAGHHLRDCSLPSACRGWGWSYMYERRQKSKGNPSVLTCHLLEKGSATMHHCAHQEDSNLPGIVLCPLPIAPEEHQNYRHVLLCPDVCAVLQIQTQVLILAWQGPYLLSISSTHGGASQLPTTPPWETTSPTILCSCAAPASSLHFAQDLFSQLSAHQRGRFWHLWFV